MSLSPRAFRWGYAAPARPDKDKRPVSWLLPALPTAQGADRLRKGCRGHKTIPQNTTKSPGKIPPFPKNPSAGNGVSRGCARWKAASCVSKEGGFAEPPCKALGLCWWITEPESNPGLRHPRASLTVLAASWRRSVVDRARRIHREKNRSSAFAKSFSAPRTEMLAKHRAARGESQLPMNDFCRGF